MRQSLHCRMYRIDLCTVIFLFVVSFRIWTEHRHGLKWLLCSSATFTTQRRNQRRIKRNEWTKNAVVFLLRLFSRFFFFLFRALFADKGIVRYSLLRQMRAHQFTEKIYVCVLFPQRFKYDFFVHFCLVYNDAATAHSLYKLPQHFYFFVCVCVGWPTTNNENRISLFKFALCFVNEWIRIFKM